MLNLHKAVAEVEAEIEKLSEGVEQCRKGEVAAKAAMVLGGLLLVPLMIGVIQSKPVALVLIAAALGGLVLFGSNKTTLDEIVEAIRKLEARRIEVIDELELRAVND